MAGAKDGSDVVVERRGEAGGRQALVLPGLNFTADMPVLHYTIRTLQARGWTVDVVRWKPPRHDANPWARQQTTALIQQSRPDLVVGKSLGTWGLLAATATGCAGIWLTPLLYHPELTARPLDRRHLLIGGTADRSWVPATAAASGAQVMEITGADHSLELPDVPGSIAVLADIQRRQDNFLNNLHL